MGLLCWRGLAEIEWSIWRLQDEYGDVGAYFSTKADLEHMWGVQYVLRVWPMGEEFFWQCKKARRLLILPYARGRKAHCTRQLLTEMRLVAPCGNAGGALSSRPPLRRSRLLLLRRNLTNMHHMLRRSHRRRATAAGFALEPGRDPEGSADVLKQ